MKKILAYVNDKSAIFEIDDRFGHIKNVTDGGEHVVEFVPEYKIRELLSEFRKAIRIEVDTINCVIERMKHVCTSHV